MSMKTEQGACGTCASRQHGALQKLGLRLGDWDHVVALAGNPNTGKSTVFNALTGLRQHTGNWPGKTIARAEGGFSFDDARFKLVDLPGTYSLLSASPDEEVARDFILFGRPDVTIIVADATALDRNLNLALQVLQITSRAILCLNLMDEAKAHGIEIDCRGLARDLGVPVVPTVARRGEGIDQLLREVHAMASGETRTKPRKLRVEVPGLRDAVDELVAMLEERFPGIPHAPWIALRLLEGDRRIADAVSSGELGDLSEDHSASLVSSATSASQPVDTES